jgi:hypothetical protein
VGTANNLGERAKTAQGGRERTGAAGIREYTKGDSKGRQEAEQKGINDRGGKGNLENKRDEIRREKMDRSRDRPAEMMPPTTMQEFLSWLVPVLDRVSMNPEVQIALSKKLTKFPQRYDGKLGHMATEKVFRMWHRV